jgi:hypothetical protein
VSLTVAVMQPYFLPYPGYFRLIAQSDLFVAFDCVQFPRRGWVHRNRLRDRAGELQWLTLPLAYAPQSAQIRDLAFAPDAALAMAERLRPFRLEEEAVRALVERLRRPSGPAADFIIELLAEVCARLGLRFVPIRSSALGLPEALKGQERILEILRRLGADRYLNAPGGRELYDPEAFAQAGVALDFLPPWEGSFESVLETLRRGEGQGLAAALGAPAQG